MNRFFNTLKGKLIIFILLSALFPLFFLGYTAYSTSVRAIKNQANTLVEAIINEKIAHFKSSMGQAQSLLSSIIENQRFIAIIKKKQSNYFERLSAESEIGEILANYLHIKGLIGIDVNLLDGRAFHVGGLAEHYFINKKDRNALISTAMNNGHQLYWSGITNKTSQHKAIIPAIFIIKQLDIETMQEYPLGILQLTFSVESFYRLFKNNSNKNISFMLLDQYHHIIYHPDKSRINHQISPDLIQKMRQKAGKFSLIYESEESELIYKQLTGLNWRLIGIIPTAPQKEMIKKIAEITIFLLTFAFVILNLGIYYINKRVIKPINYITAQFEKINNNNFEQGEVPSSQIIEVKALTQGLESSVKNAKAIFEVKNEIEQAHKKTQDSIQFAALIQQAILPKEDKLQNYLSDYFIFWQPKDTVGGDIYFIDEIPQQNELIVMVIDGAGHGVSGAFVTMLVKAIQSQIIAKLQNSDLVPSPALILASFNRQIKQMLGQHRKAKSNAGFDGAILSFNKKTNICKFAGAKTDLYQIHQGQLKVIKGDRKSVGFTRIKIDQTYTEHQINVNKETVLYLATDGIIDQIGLNQQAYSKAKFKAFILAQVKKSTDLSFQKEQLIDTLKQHQGDLEQMDDITVMGLKF